MAADWEYEYNGVIIGGNTDYGIKRVEGLSRPDHRESVVDYAARHGAFGVSRYLPPRRIVIEGDIAATSFATFMTRVQALDAALIPRTSDLPLKFKFPGHVEKRINCKPTRFHYEENFDFQQGLVDMAIQFLAVDPRIYAETLSTLNIAATTGSGSNTLANAGNFPTPPSLTIRGPGTTFTVTNTTTGELWKLNTTLTSSQQAIVDFNERTVVRENGTNLYGSLDPTSLWWELQPGNNAITVAIASGFGTNSRFDFSWRSAWIGV